MDRVMLLLRASKSQLSSLEVKLKQPKGELTLNNYDQLCVTVLQQNFVPLMHCA